MKLFQRAIVCSIILLSCVCGAQGEDKAGCQRQGTLVSAFGVGKLAPEASSLPKARLLAVRAAIVEARKNLLACLLGKDPREKADIRGTVRGALVTDVQYLAGGLVKVTVTLDTAEAP